ncbi:hypothetical protein ACCD06_15155 [Azospirillum sp. CT11-132]|uniref:hypothetical protein n=1 Tax=Azospirillum sp. CT11-132 TaxID=3396317 RepID=UPI0039A57B95
MEFKIHTLNIDLINDKASIILIREEQPKSTLVSVDVPITTPGNQPEHHLKKIAIDEAKKALREAIDVLDRA